MMNFKLHSLVFGLVGVMYGLGDLLAPELVLRSNGMSEGLAAAATARFAGCLCIAWALTVVLARGTSDRAAQQAILLGGLVYSIAATIVAVYSYLVDLAGAQVFSLLLLTVPMGGNATRLLVGLRSPTPASDSTQPA